MILNMMRSRRLIMECEMCERNYIGDVINVGVDIGIHLGDYGKEKYEEYKEKPKCVGVFSIYVCNDCKNKIEKQGYLQIKVVKELKKLIKNSMLKSMIIDGLR